MTDTVKIKPLNDRVVVKPKEIEEQSKGGILMPGSSDQNKSKQGTVVAVGAGRVLDGKRVKLELEVGQRVLFRPHSGTELDHLGDEYLVLREDDVMAIIE